MKANLFSWASVCIILLFLYSSCTKSSANNNSGNNNSGNTGNNSDSANTVFASSLANDNGSGSFAFGPTGVTADAQGNVYAAITGSDDIVKISAAGTVSIFAGSQNNPGCEPGKGTSATFTDPYALCMDAQGNIYVADYLCTGIKRISPDGTSAIFCKSDPANDVIIAPQAICIDPQGNIYSADQLGEDGITKTTPQGAVSRIAGAISVNGYKDGAAADAQFEGPSGICADANGNVYVADAHRIRKISNGQVSTIAGNANIGFSNGKGSAATFGGAMGLCMGPDGNVYIADVYNEMIRMMTPDGTVTTVSGTGVAGLKNGSPNSAQFDQPSNLSFDSKGNLYVADYGNAIVRKITFPK